jgi:hypothetical protein
MAECPETERPAESDAVTRAEADEQAFILAPPDGMSEAERLLRSRTYPPVSDGAMPPRRRFQFTIAGLMTMIFFVALGLAGRSWMPSTLFAGLLGLLTAFCLWWVIARPPETSAARLVWWGILLAYIVAILATLIPTAT